jgi:homoserine O-acetyltransferase/O-succinyltransferase
MSKQDAKHYPRPTDPDNVGIVEPDDHTFAEPPDPMPLDSGATLGPITLRYETYGQLDPKRRNAILIQHALSGDHHAAGFHSADDRKPGWWDTMVGPGKAFDTRKYFVICSNSIGGCMGSTGPASTDPSTGKPFGMQFPLITIGDMVRAQRHLIDHLGVDQLLTVVGGSMGGMKVIEWAAAYPERLRSAIPIATTPRLGAQSIAFNEVGRQAIMADPNWKCGDYYSGPTPDRGLAIARMIGHITYLSDESMRAKFGRRLRNRTTYSYDFLTDFEVESYLHYQGEEFIQRFDANSYLYISKAMDYYDATERGGSLEAALARSRFPFLVLAYSSDWLFPPAKSKKVVLALQANDIPVTYSEISSIYGHDAFLLETTRMTRLIGSFLGHVYQEAQQQP